MTRRILGRFVDWTSASPCADAELRKAEEAGARAEQERFEHRRKESQEAENRAVATAGGNASKMALACAVATMTEPADAWGFAPKIVKRKDTVPPGMWSTICTQTGKKTARIPDEIPTGKFEANKQAQTQWADAYIELLKRELKTGGDDVTREARRFVGDADSNLTKLKAVKSTNRTPRLKKALQLAKYQDNEYAKPPKLKDTDFYITWRAMLQQAIDTENVDEMNKYVTENGGKLKKEALVSAAKRLLRN